jgi:hypothetical protein
MKLDVRAALAILVVLGAFLIVGVPYVAFGRAPDKDVLLFANGAQLLVLGYFFGHINGAQTALTNSAVQLAQQAIEKRQQPSGVPIVATLPVSPAAGPPAPAS